MSGILTPDQRVTVVKAAQPHLADRPGHHLLAESLDVEIVLAGGRPPGMSYEVLRRTLEEARKVMGEKP